MPATPLAPELLAAIPGITTRLSAILAALAALVARAFLKHPVHVAHINPLWAYINRTARRFTRALDSLAAGTLRAGAPRPGRQPHPRKPMGFPSQHAWLLAALRHEAAVFGNQLTRLLEQPEARALLAAAPQAVRLLRPLCHILGVTPAPLARPAKPKPPPAPSPPASRAQPRATPTHSHAPSILGPRPPQPLCPRLLDRWPWNALRHPSPA